MDKETEPTLLGPRRRVLVAEDDAEMRRMLVEVLEADGFEVLEAANGFDLYQKLQTWTDSRTWPVEETPGLALVISDIRMPGVTGLELIKLVGEELPQLPFVLITGFPDPPTREEARRLHVSAFLAKPFEIDDLEQAVSDALLER